MMQASTGLGGRRGAIGLGAIALVTACLTLAARGPEAPQSAQSADADARSEDEIRARFQEFNAAWERRDPTFIDGYFARDPDLLLFFERRQLSGWPRVETLYRNMFANASGGAVRSTASNVRVGARGDMGWLAANFHLEVTNPAGERAVDQGRQSIVYERRGGRWVVVHRHTSFQAPPGPHRPVPLHTEPGPLWDPTLEGAWRREDGDGLMIATATHIAFAGVEPLPAGATYTIREGQLRLAPVSATTDVEETVLTLEQLEVTTARVTFTIMGPNGAEPTAWRRLE